MPKRKSSGSFARSSKRAKQANRRATKRKANYVDRTQNKRLKRIERMIETKEMQTRSAANFALAHNNVTVVQMVDPVGADLNPFYCNLGPNDPMNSTGNRIGDKITIKGVLIRGFLENALSRAKVYYRIMLVKTAKGDSITRLSLYKGDANNKMIDQINTERYTILAQKILNVSASNNVANAVDATGVPSGGTSAGIATRTFKMWIPGRKFGRGGNITYENNSSSQVKFYDYRLVIVAYDWYGTPQDVNNVGRVNELYTKLYFQDA